LEEGLLDRSRIREVDESAIRARDNFSSIDLVSLACAKCNTFRYAFLSSEREAESDIFVLPFMLGKGERGEASGQVAHFKEAIKQLPTSTGFMHVLAQDFFENFACQGASWGVGFILLFPTIATSSLGQVLGLQLLRIWR
jgi:hypothetical protein